MKNLVKIRRRSIFLISLLFLSLSLIIITPNSRAAQSFPESIKEVTNLKYSFYQDFKHSDPNLVSGEAGGVITIDITKNQLFQLNFSIHFDLDVYHKGCDPKDPDPYYFNKELGLIVDPLTRYVEDVYKYTADHYPSTLLDPHYASYFLDNHETFNVGSMKYMMRDDLFIFRQEMVTSYFEIKGIKHIELHSQKYKTIHLRNVSLMGYDGSICGIGSGIGINSTIDYYYEYESGILLYSNSFYKEFYALNPAIYQEHQWQ